jgi:hypothetical protein
MLPPVMNQVHCHFTELADNLRGANMYTRRDSKTAVALDEPSAKSILSCQMALFYQLLMVCEGEPSHGHHTIESPERSICRVRLKASEMHS